jgi:hypothetical protein
MILIDYGGHSGIYDNLTPGGRGQWVLGDNLKPQEAQAKYRYPVPYHGVAPHEFRSHLIKLLVHASKQSDVPKVPAHNIVGQLRIRLPKPSREEYPRLNCIVMNHDTYVRDIIQPAMDTWNFWCRLQRPWNRLHKELHKLPHILFDPNVPDKMVLGLSLPEHVGVLTYTNWGWQLGAMINQKSVRAVKIK